MPECSAGRAGEARLRADVCDQTAAPAGGGPRDRFLVGRSAPWIQHVTARASGFGGAIAELQQTVAGRHVPEATTAG